MSTSGFVSGVVLGFLAAGSSFGFAPPPPPAGAAGFLAPPPPKKLRISAGILHERMRPQARESCPNDC